MGEDNIFKKKFTKTQIVIVYCVTAIISFSAFNWIGSKPLEDAPELPSLRAETLEKLHKEHAESSKVIEDVTNKDNAKKFLDSVAKSKSFGGFIDSAKAENELIIVTVKDIFNNKSHKERKQLVFGAYGYWHSTVMKKYPWKTKIKVINSAGHEVGGTDDSEVGVWVRK